MIAWYHSVSNLLPILWNIKKCTMPTTPNPYYRSPIFVISFRDFVSWFRFVVSSNTESQSEFGIMDTFSSVYVFIHVSPSLNRYQCCSEKLCKIWTDRHLGRNVTSVIQNCDGKWRNCDGKCKKNGMKMPTMGYKKFVVRTHVLYYLEGTLYHKTLITWYAMTWVPTARPPSLPQSPCEQNGC